MSNVDGGGSPGAAGWGGSAGAGVEAVAEADAWGVAAPDMNDVTRWPVSRDVLFRSVICCGVTLTSTSPWSGRAFSAAS